jgi:hypothetical protein
MPASVCKINPVDLLICPASESSTAAHTATYASAATATHTAKGLW